MAGINFSYFEFSFFHSAIGCLSVIFGAFNLAFWALPA